MTKERKEYIKKKNDECRDRLKGETFKCKGCNNDFYLDVAGNEDGLCLKCRK